MSPVLSPSLRHCPTASPALSVVVSTAVLSSRSFALRCLGCGHKMASSFRKMATAKTVLLFCTSSVANIAVPFLPLHCMQAERSIDAKNSAELRAQTLKPFQEYGTALRIRNSTKNTEMCARLQKTASNIRKCTAIKWPPRRVQRSFCLRLQRYSRDLPFSFSSCKQIEVLSQETGRIEGTWR